MLKGLGGNAIPTPATYISGLAQTVIGGELSKHDFAEGVPDFFYKISVAWGSKLNVLF